MFRINFVVYTFILAFSNCMGRPLFSLEEVSNKKKFV